MKTILLLLFAFAFVSGLTEPQDAHAADCSSAVRQAEAQTGGQAIGSPRAQQSGGRTVCVVTVLITDPSGKSPPSRRTVSVPAN
ncbi:MAG: hypothetical protein AAGA88_04490 [Pseudomonadota bacterium]